MFAVGDSVEGVVVALQASGNFGRATPFDSFKTWVEMGAFRLEYCLDGEDMSPVVAEFV